MNSREIKLKRLESILKELIGETISSLNDNRINSLTILDVRLKSKENGIVYIFDDGLLENKNEILRQLRKSVGYINEFCLSSQDFFKMPRLEFKFDDKLNEELKLEKIFAQISKNKKAE